MKRASIWLTALIMPFCLAACAGSGSTYPSLAKRPVERVTGTAEPAGSDRTTPPPPPANAQLRERIGQLVASASAAHEAFLARIDGARSTVSASKGAAVASEGWTQAQVALAGLEALRSEALISLAELDQLYVAERVAYPDAPTPSAIALADAQNEIEGWVASENQEIAALQSQSGS